MLDKQKLHTVAQRWMEKFRDQDINYIELVDHFMADDCKELGFQMDCGNAFGEKYGDAVHDNEALSNIIDSIDDIPLLGSAVYSRWRYFNHWAYDGAEILKPKNREWFLMAWARLSKLSCERPLGIDGLLTLDDHNKSDVINRITVNYHRVTKIKPEKPLDNGIEYVTWDYSEWLVLDRKTETITHTQNVGTGCVITQSYKVQDGVADFLDSLDGNYLFANIRGNPDDVMETPLETKDYVITIDLKCGAQRVIKGSFDRHGLPDDWAEFADDVFNFMIFYGSGEIFNPSIFCKAKQRKRDYVFCSVSFDEGSKTYYYLAGDNEISVGDTVIVPVGKDNRESIAKVEKLEYFSDENVPFPIEKTKRIIRKFDEEEPNDA